MPHADDLDGIDFKPFFDMAVGILFVLLILVASLLFFQKTEGSESAAAQAERRAREWQLEAAAFLDRLAGRLHEHGIEARVDLANMAVVLPLSQIAALGRDGLPEMREVPIDDLGHVLADSMGCVSAASDHSGPCSAFGLLRLDEAVAELRTGAPAPRATLPQGRLGHLLTSEFTAALLKGTPDMLRLSARDGGVVLRVVGALGTEPASEAASIGGDLSVRFSFAPP